MNKMAVVNLLKKKSEGLSVPYDALQMSYFFDCFLKRVEKSKHKDQLFLKGGLLLSSMLGINLRRTIDIDFSLRKITLNLPFIKTIIEEIVNLDVSDNVKFEISSYENIRKEDIYGGFRVNIIGRLENIKQPFSVDFATGDPITGTSPQYQHVPLIGNPIKIQSYNIETYLAEKIQTIYQKGLTNSRSKDFYDVYICSKVKANEIRFSVFKEALKNTFLYRKTELNIEKIIVILDELRNNDMVNARWISYSAKNSFANGIKFEMVISEIKMILLSKLPIKET